MQRRSKCRIAYSSVMLIRNNNARLTCSRSLQIRDLYTSSRHVGLAADSRVQPILTLHRLPLLVEWVMYHTIGSD
jgi:hypothetical protein